MTHKSQIKDPTGETSNKPLDTITDLQEAGLGNLMGLGAAWAEAVGEMGAEVVSFVADRIKEDVKTQHQILNCKDVNELHKIQSEFVQKAMEQYHAETEKLIGMGTKAFASGAKGKNTN